MPSSNQNKTLEDYLQLKTDIIENKTDDLFKHLNELSRETLTDLKDYLGDFDYANGKYINNEANQLKILGLKKFLYQILKDKFNIGLKDYQKQFNVIEQVNIDIQKFNNINYEPTETIRTFVNQTVIDKLTLTKAIDNSTLTTNIQNAFNRYVSGQFSRQQAVKNITEITIKDKGLSRWANTISGDALRVYDGKLQQEIKASNELINGSFYNGTLIDTSRLICVDCVGRMKKNGFIWFDEVPGLVEQYKNDSGYDANMPLTVNTFLEVDGGHGCRHNQSVGYKRKK